MTREYEILQFLQYHPNATRKDIEAGMSLSVSSATLKRILSALVESGSATVTGQGRATRYAVSPQAHITMPLDVDAYFLKEIDERIVQTSFNFELINSLLPRIEIFTDDEKKRLDSLQAQFSSNIKDITPGM